MMGRRREQILQVDSTDEQSPRLDALLVVLRYDKSGFEQTDLSSGAIVADASFHRTNKLEIAKLGSRLISHVSGDENSEIEYFGKCNTLPAKCKVEEEQELSISK
eukprot:gene17988-biopygen5208